MPFIVKATNKKTGNEAWLAVADGRGFHMLATREMAATFETVEDAKTAIKETRKALLASEHLFVIKALK
jgi:hypothetical protein